MFSEVFLKSAAMNRVIVRAVAVMPEITDHRSDHNKQVQQYQRNGKTIVQIKCSLVSVGSAQAIIHTHFEVNSSLAHVIDTCLL